VCGVTDKPAKSRGFFSAFRRSGESGTEKGRAGGQRGLFLLHGPVGKFDGDSFLPVDRHNH